MPGIMINTIHEATMMKAWSPEEYHWFRFSVARENCQLPPPTHDNDSSKVLRPFWRKLCYTPESPPVSELVPLKTAGAPIHEYDMVPE